MVTVDSHAALKKILRKEVASICRRSGATWNRSIIEIVDELKEMDCPAVFFGGTLRSLLMSRYWDGKPGRPRDIDIVVQGAKIDALKERFKKRLSRETRFGGLQLRSRDWLFDVWPLDSTWAFNHDGAANPRFCELPSTTFFNVEAIAMDAWTERGRSRNIYDGNDQFYNGIVDRVLEINRIENPYPDLCVVRALVFAGLHGFSIGLKLATYLSQHGGGKSVDDFERVQVGHYGLVRIRGGVMSSWVRSIRDQLDSGARNEIRLPIAEQLSMWPEEEKPRFKIQVI